ncbi:sensor histidine kinase [Sphingobacterium hungaricum]|uniref:histidine kinase n=1 Tax=Sphingobacterium hungaricum TaxID=2082723 RepID=A0A928YQW4_9SPHI|nr:HAMP domain-containing sensor histidine kinase [Sphingobacterium hungaricum]MBE8714686.1 sensor histidine kinase [Sphingobacterium hungaricum]
MAKVDVRYRKNFGLLIAFLIVVTLLYVVTVLLGRNLMTNFVEAEFNNRKAEVFDETIKPFNDFFYSKIPEVSYYQGFLDVNQASGISNTILRKNPFIEKIVFYDILFTNNRLLSPGISFNNLLFHPKSTYTFNLDPENKLVKTKLNAELTKQYADDFNNMAIKVVSFLDRVNYSSRISDADLYKVYYSVNPGKITYLNIPRKSDLLSYKNLMEDPHAPLVEYEQDWFIFLVDPQKLAVVNRFTNLYESIEIIPVVNSSLNDDANSIITEFPLPGALSDYKLSFKTTVSHLTKEINRRFIPVVFGVSVLYIVLLMIAYLINRNILINSKLYRLQYDFINNLTHEFKTPVSVIKIAGNNIQSADRLSDEERQMYGRILDQEADKLNNLMNKLLSFSQIENKSIKFKAERIDLNDFFDSIFSAIKLKYPDLQLDYSVNVEKDLYADPVLLSSVFQNLIDNAYKYSEPDKKFLSVKAQQNKKNIVITFEDKGIGINKVEFNKIFKKFYRVKNQFNQQGSIGLGLAFCKEVTEFMGGEIKVVSKQHEGTTFTLIFPV